MSRQSSFHYHRRRRSSSESRSSYSVGGDEDSSRSRSSSRDPDRSWRRREGYPGGWTGPDKFGEVTVPITVSDSRVVEFLSSTNCRLLQEIREKFPHLSHLDFYPNKSRIIFVGPPVNVKGAILKLFALMRYRHGIFCGGYHQIRKIALNIPKDAELNARSEYSEVSSSEDSRENDEDSPRDEVRRVRWNNAESGDEQMSSNESAAESGECSDHQQCRDDYKNLQSRMNKMAHNNRNTINQLKKSISRNKTTIEEKEKLIRDQNVNINNFEDKIKILEEEKDNLKAAMDNYDPSVFYKKSQEFENKIKEQEHLIKELRQKLVEKSLDPGSFKIEPAESEGDGTTPSLQKQLSNSKKEYTYLCWKYNQKKDLITLRDGEIRYGRRLKLTDVKFMLDILDLNALFCHPRNYLSVCPKDVHILICCLEIVLTASTF